MHPDPDYSAAYVVMKTDEGPEGHGFTFTIGRGNEICVEAIRAFAPLVIGRKLRDITADFAGFWRSLASETQLRWLGPEKGVIHISMAAVVNAVWDLYAKTEGKPVWKLLADMTPRQLVSCIDFRYITDALTPDEAIEILERSQPGRKGREAQLLRDDYPAYTTSVGWMGYSDEYIRERCLLAIADGWRHFKVKVGAAPEEDARRMALVRGLIGPDMKLMADANQRWDVNEAIERVRALAPFDLWWIEEPTSPDDVLGHAAIAKAIAPIKLATGEMCQNRVVFKQLLQAGALGYCQVDSCRVGGVNEVLAILLLAAKFGVPVCPHAGGVGLSEYVQHLAIYDYIALNPSVADRYCEYVDHLHQHFVHPVRVVGARYQAPLEPGYSIEMKAASLAAHEYPGGSVWKA
jgi:L-fuconate dehydratase